MPLTTVFSIFDATDAYRDNPKQCTPAYDAVFKADGSLAPAYYGIQIENPNTAYIFINWVNHDAHSKFLESEGYPVVRGTFRPFFAGKVESYHVEFASVEVALAQQVTEVVVLTLKAPDNRAAVVEVLSGFSEKSEGRLVFGQTHEDENKYVILCGWPSVEAHQEASQKPEIAEGLDKLWSLANKEHSYHANVSSYSG